MPTNVVTARAAASLPRRRRLDSGRRADRPSVLGDAHGNRVHGSMSAERSRSLSGSRRRHGSGFFPSAAVWQASDPSRTQREGRRAPWSTNRGRRIRT